MTGSKLASKYIGLAVAVFLLSACEPGASPLSGRGPVMLFDGTSLAGWKVSEESPESFRVENGAIVVQGPRAHLFYDGEYGTEFTDFELSLKIKTEPGANSGVYFHTTYQARDWPKNGLEAQINATHHDVRKTGSLYSVADIRVYKPEDDVPELGFHSNAYVTRSAAPHADLEWFDYVIRVEDGVVSTRVNGKLLVEWRQPEDWDNGNVRVSSGTFALQAHDPESKVYFKKIVVRALN